MDKIIFEINKIFHEYFDLQTDRAPFKDIVKSIEKGVVFKGSNLWILMAAIIIASVGLNVNSTAVIIGAMLISPLMGPIIGIGLGMGIFDLDLIIKSAKNLGIAVLISVIISALYFYITPIADAQSELLARTTPTIWDVLIGFFGGFAGIIGVTRKEKTNVIPGVAIATALMPPICTAGFGIATGNPSYFFGAFYLFFINSVFIAISSMIVVRYMHFPIKEWLDEKQSRQWKRNIFIIGLITAIPSIYLAYGIVKRTIFSENANNYITHEIVNDNTVVLQSKIDPKTKTIDVYIIGNPLDQRDQQKLRERLGDYSLSGATLNIRQNLDSNLVDPATMRAGIVEDLYKRTEDEIQAKNEQIESLRSEIESYKNIEELQVDISRELEAQFPSIVNTGMNKMIFHSRANVNDTTLVVVIKSRKRITSTEKQNITNWLKVRTDQKKVKIITE